MAEVRQSGDSSEPEGRAIAYFSHGESHAGILLAEAGGLRVLNWQHGTGWKEDSAVVLVPPEGIVEVAAARYGSRDSSGRYGVEVFAVTRTGKLVSAHWAPGGEREPWVVREADRGHRGVAAAKVGVNRIDIYSITGDEIARYRLENRIWKLPQPMAMPADSGHPLALAAQDGGLRSDLLVLTDRHLLRRTFNAARGRWSGWEERQLLSAGHGLAASSLGPDHLEVFVNDNQTIWHQWRQDAVGWSGWHEFTPCSVDSPVRIAAGSRSRGYQDLFALGAGGRLVGTGYGEPEGWASWSDVLTPQDAAVAPTPNEAYDRVSSPDLLRSITAPQPNQTPTRGHAPDQSRIRERSLPVTADTRPVTAPPDPQGPLMLFISYHRPDEATFGMVKSLREHVPARFASFTGRKLEVFLDVEAPGGVKWEQNIRQKAGECDFFLPMLTTAYLGSVNCRNEVKWFLESRDEADQRVSIVPINLVPQSVLERYCPRDAKDLLDSLSVFNWIDASSGEAGPVLRHLVDRTLVPFMDALHR